MRNIKMTTGFKALLIIIVLGRASFAQQETKMENIWSGKSTDSELLKLAPTDKCITDKDSWKKLWKSWKGNEKLPEIDFQKHFVVVGTAKGPNRVKPHMRMDEKDANLKVVFAATKMGGPGFGFVLVEMKRAGIKSINGVPLAPPALSEVVQVAVSGKLEHGIMAIGGETTGTTITANGITWELQLGANEEFRKTAEEKNGKMVQITGELTRKMGVERGARFIVIVESIK